MICPRCARSLIADPEVDGRGLCPSCGGVYSQLASGRVMCHVFCWPEAQFRQSQPGERPDWSGLR